MAKMGIVTIKLTPHFKRALIEVMRAECEMMIKVDPDLKDVWYWGRCMISDLTYAECLSFEFGDRDSQPRDGRGRFGVIES